MIKCLECGSVLVSGPEQKNQTQFKILSLSVL